MRPVLSVPPILRVLPLALLTACPASDLARAKELEASGQQAEAGARYVEIAKRDPANLAAWDAAIDLHCRKAVNVGMCMGVLDLELDLLGNLERHKDALAEALELRARARTDQGLVDAALSDLERAERAGPRRSTLFTARARALIQIGKREEAIAALERARALDPKNGEVDELVGMLPDPAPPAAE